MRRTSLVAAVSIAAALAALLAACDKNPTRPSAGRLPSGTPSPTPAPVTIVRIELAGPGSVNLGGTAQFTATAHQSDGTTRDVTSEAVWRSGNSSVLSVSSTGLASGHSNGETAVSASLQGRNGVRADVIVVPAGTYRLTGSLKEDGLQLSGVTIEIRTSTNEIRRLTANGIYKVYGVSGDTQVTVIKDGYESQTKRVDVTSHQSLDFDLVLSRPRADVSGRYTLTVTAADSCASLPEEARVRRYTAVVTQNGPRVSVTLEGAKFLTDRSRTRNSFNGVIEPSRVTFQLAESYYYYYYYTYPDVFEELTPTEYLSIGGLATTTAGATGLSGTLDGVISILQYPQMRMQSGCRASGHRFVFTR
jgi:hypothetical protein